LETKAFLLKTESGKQHL